MVVLFKVIWRRGSLIVDDVNKVIATAFLWMKCSLFDEFTIMGPTIKVTQEVVIEEKEL